MSALPRPEMSSEDWKHFLAHGLLVRGCEACDRVKVYLEWSRTQGRHGTGWLARVNAVAPSPSNAQESTSGSGLP